MEKTEGGVFLQKISPSSDLMKRVFEKKQALELKFKHITYSVTSRTWKYPFSEKKEILHGVSGEFLPGKLTAIMGPSGAGKSTLLNVLAGYKVHGADGQVFVNGEERNNRRLDNFLRQSCYIQQDSYLREKLTVQEAMMVAAELKLGRLVNRNGKKMRVVELLNMLGLGSTLKTMIGRLSGGQKRRLSLALELLTNPPIIFLDEPTTGLDSTSSSQCVSIFKMLALEGRTVICTIHQPSALIFEKFDNLYSLAGGHCLYSGPVRDVVPFLGSHGFQCPIYHNPADYILEVSVGEHGPVMGTLITPENIPKDERKKLESNITLGNNLLEDFKESLKRRKIFSNDGLGVQHDQEHVPQPNSFFMEFYYLYMRNLIILQRSYRLRIVTFLAHFLLSALVGYTFYNVGNNAQMVRSNLAFVFAVLLFLIFVGLMSVLVILPSDIKSLRAEHFNQWYSLRTYYLAILSVEIPMQTFNCIIAFPPLYFLSDQPMEVFRYVAFLALATLSALAAQAHGFVLGAGVPLRIAVYIGPVFSCVLAVFGFTLRMCDTPIIFQLLSFFSYVRSSFHSISFVLYGFGRANMYCDPKEFYCHFKTPDKILDEMDMNGIDVYANIGYIVFVIAVLHVFTYIILHRRLTKR